MRRHLSRAPSICRVLLLTGLLAGSAAADDLLPTASAEPQVRPIPMELPAEAVREAGLERLLAGRACCPQCGRVRGAGGAGPCYCPCPPSTAGEPSAPQAPESVADQAQREAAPPADDYSAMSGASGATAGAASAVPQVIGDQFGSSIGQTVIRTTVPYALTVAGYLIDDGDPLVYAYRAANGTTDAFYSAGPISSAPPTYRMTEPLPPNDVPTAPGPTYVWNGGTVTYGGTSPFPYDGESWEAQYSFTETLVIEGPAGGGAVLRRLKIAENNSPLPRDRVYWTFNYFNDVNFGFGDVRRHTLGIEKTLCCGLMSLDVRVPLYSTLAADQNVDEQQVTETEFGNLTAIWKMLLHQGCRGALSAGVGLGAPTGRDTNLYRAGDQHILHLSNDAAHVMPFLGGLWTPREDWFCQGFLQLDIDANGNRAAGSYQGADETGRLPRLGRIQDATMLYADGVVGYWLYRNPCGNVLTAVAPVAELHYASTLTDTDAVEGYGLTVTGGSRRFDILNLTLGTHLQFGDHLLVTPAMAIPLRTGDDEQFDYEATVQMNWLF